ncbi:unnamed protein product [Symbiodinium natans]|uniref:H(+)-exporting diphosphatase n=1 Tax=Symbiodinium natans TaxID=878477 RepID=A0A812SE28_9DINO|nr:unnamed protein product [Symbiodinium natans]
MALPGKLRVTGLSAAFFALALLAIGCTCAVVALVGVWWKGALRGTVAGLASAHGDLSLWTFATSADLPEGSLTSKSIHLDSTVLCGGASFAVRAEEICSGIQTTRALVGAAVAFAVVAVLAALLSFVAMLNCGGKLDLTMGTRLLLPCSGMAVVASGLMIGAVVTGAVAGHAMGLGDFGTLSYAMGAGVYGAIFQIIANLLGAALATSAWPRAEL